MLTRMQAVQPPIIPIVAELIRQYPGTISLGQGVVNYGPPPLAIAQISQFLSQPDNHKYQAVEGIPALQQAIVAKLQQDNGITLSADQCIVVTAGSNMAFMNAVLAITSPGDEIILQTPYYFNHEMAIAMASCQAILVSTDEQHQLQVDKIKQAITAKTRAIVTISPNNPTGAVYSAEALQAVNQLCRSHGLYHISDEAYEYFTYGVSHFSPGSIPDCSSQTISLYSLSKAYGFASWRIGYMVIPLALFESVRKIQDTILICPTVVAQFAAVGALQAGVNYCRERLPEIAQVREIVLTELDRIPHLCTIPAAAGAFYFFLKIPTDLTSMALVERLIRSHGVAVIPGSTFGMAGCYLRVAYGSLSADTAREGIGRLVQGLKAECG